MRTALRRQNASCITVLETLVTPGAEVIEALQAREQAKEWKELRKKRKAEGRALRVASIATSQAAGAFGASKGLHAHIRLKRRPKRATTHPQPRLQQLLTLLSVPLPALNALPSLLPLPIMPPSRLCLPPPSSLPFDCTTNSLLPSPTASLRTCLNTKRYAIHSYCERPGIVSVSLVNSRLWLVLHDWYC